MEEFMQDDICEQILVRLDVKDLTICKSVCKSWKSLISRPRFIKAHHTRQVNLIPYRKAIIPNYLFKYGLEYCMVGSSNGLACITSFNNDEIIVANPWTREERILQKPRGVDQYSCWGFGYDSLTDDYKVVHGGAEGVEKTTFQVLSLKSNVWKHVGHVNYAFSGVVQIGTLCHGALHWVMFRGYKVTPLLMISFDLSKEVFTEINQPGDGIRKCRFLAIKEKCVGIFNEHRGRMIMEMKKYNVKLYWENMGHYWKLNIESEDPSYTFIPTTVMSSLISPHLQEDNE